MIKSLNGAETPTRLFDVLRIISGIIVIDYAFSSVLLSRDKSFFFSGIYKGGQYELYFKECYNV